MFRKFKYIPRACQEMLLPLTNFFTKKIVEKQPDNKINSKTNRQSIHFLFAVAISLEN